MPAVGQAGHDDDVPDWSKRLAAQNDGENPVHYLDRPLEDLGTARALIRGIDRIQRARIWLAAERRLGRDDGSPGRVSSTSSTNVSSISRSMANAPTPFLLRMGRRATSALSVSGRRSRSGRSTASRGVRRAPGLRRRSLHGGGHSE